LRLPIEYVPATHGGPTDRVALERAIFLTPTHSVTTELSLSLTGFSSEIASRLTLETWPDRRTGRPTDA